MVKNAIPHMISAIMFSSFFCFFWVLPLVVFLGFGCFHYIIQRHFK